MKNYIPNFEQLDKLTEEGYLRKVISPCGKQVLYNYTDMCTFKREWNEHTLNSRGTVYEIETGRVIARAFPKFFNLSELPLKEQMEYITRNDFVAFDKADGSLGIVYYYDGRWQVNTRGSFISDQSVKAEQLLEKYDLSQLDRSDTYLCEIIYPENKIIVNYGNEEKLVHLATYNTLTGSEIDSKTPFEACTIDSYDSVEKLLELQQEIPKDKEGWVLKFSTGERVKIKGLEYLQIARILKGCSPLVLWEKMIDGEVDVEFVQSIPEEIFPEIKPIIEHLEEKYNDMMNMILIDATEIAIQLDLYHDLGCFGTIVRYSFENESERKKLGLFLKENKFEHQSAMFPLFLGNDEALEKYIMKNIRPNGNNLI